MTAVNHLICLISSVLPATRFFPFKCLLYRFIGFRVGQNVSIGNSIITYVLGKVDVGSNTWLGRNLDISVPKDTFLRIGSNVDVAPYVKFQCGSHHVGSSFRRAGSGHSQSITIGDGCWIGMSSLILGGAHIGSGTVVAAGSVVLAGTYPENVLLAGVPAKIHKIYT